MIESNASFRQIWYESAGTRLFAVERGEGRPIVFLHGGLADHRASLSRVRGLASSSRLITPDLRGAGQSRHHGDLSWDLLAADIAGLMDHLDLDRAILGGISAGSAVALRFARLYPQRVLALILVWPAHAGREEGLTQVQQSAMCRMDAAAQQALAVGIESLYPLFDPLPLAIRAAALEIVSGFDPASVAATTRFLASGAQPFERTDELADLSVPTLIVPGTDPEHPADIAARYARAIPCCTLADPTAALVPAIETFLDAALRR